MAAPPQAEPDALVETTKLQRESDPQPTSFLIIEGWPYLGDLSNGAVAKQLWSVVQPVHTEATLLQAETLREALGLPSIEVLPLGTLLEKLATGPALTEVPFQSLFNETDPNGTESLKALASLIVSAALSDDPLPSSPTEEMSLPPELVARYGDILVAIDAVFEALPGGEALISPHLEGTAGNDFFQLDDGVLSIDGGAGLDQVAVSATVAETTLSLDGDGDIEMIAGDGPRVALHSVERISFSDGFIAFDEDGLAGQAYRLYQACFDRQPDVEGLGFWIKQLDAKTVSLSEVAGFFLGSEEFASVYGAPETVSEPDYLALLYTNVLDRTPDEEGFAFWRMQQEEGVTRTDMLVYFSESAENVAKVAPAIDDGIWYV